MQKHYRYTFLVSFDGGKLFLSVISYKLSRAKKMLCESENCPLSALELVKRERIYL